MLKKIAFTLFPVKDMARARRFYEQGLGLKLTHDFRGEWVEYDPPGGCLALSSMPEVGTPSVTAGGSVAFEVEDVDAALKKLVAAGGTVKVPPFDTPVCRMAVLADTEGNGFMLHKVTD